MTGPAPDSPLGPQCLRCRRRRVKCDSTPEACQRCGRDGYECPGYERKTKWKVVTAETMKQKRRGTISSRQSSSDSSECASPVSRTSSSGSLVMPTSLILSTIEKEILEIQSAVIYYNDSLVPDLAASPIPSETISIPMDIWLSKSPKVLHHIIVTIVTCHRLATNGSAHGTPAKGSKDESALADTLNRHRGRGLLQLQRLLSDFWHGDGDGTISEDARKRKSLVTLVSVVMLLAQEVQMSATSLWSMHLEAARSIITQLGGIEAFWSQAPMHQGLFTLYIMIDMLSPPTSPAWSINETQQTEYLHAMPKLADFERRIIASFQPCPLPVLTAIVLTNVLRSAIYKHQTRSPSSITTGLASGNASISQTLALTLASLLRFDPMAWALKVCTAYLDLPSPRRKDDTFEDAWSALATAYQSAAVLYLLRSVQTSDFVRSAGDNLEALLHEQRAKLSLSLAYLCRDLSRASASALWRFVSWPLIVHCHEIVAWSAVPTSPTSSPEEESGEPGATDLMQAPRSVTAALRRLQRVARRLGANSLFDGAELLEGIWRRRREGLGVEGRHDGLWRWDDGFEGRCVFIV